MDLLIRMQFEDLRNFCRVNSQSLTGIGDFQRGCRVGAVRWVVAISSTAITNPEGPGGPEAGRALTVDFKLSKRLFIPFFKSSYHLLFVFLA